MLFSLLDSWAELKAREPSVTKAKTRNRNIMHGSKERDLSDIFALSPQCVLPRADKMVTPLL